MRSTLVPSGERMNNLTLDEHCRCLKDVLSTWWTGWCRAVVFIVISVFRFPQVSREEAKTRWNEWDSDEIDGMRSDDTVNMHFWGLFNCIHTMQIRIIGAYLNGSEPIRVGPNFSMAFLWWQVKVFSDNLSFTRTSSNDPVYKILWSKKWTNDLVFVALSYLRLPYVGYPTWAFSLGIRLPGVIQGQTKAVGPLWLKSNTLSAFIASNTEDSWLSQRFANSFASSSPHFI